MRFVAVVLSLLLLMSGAVRAESSTSKAKDFYDQGVTDYNLGHYEEALVAFEQAYRIRHDAAFLFNIGQCQRQLHRYQPAEQSYRAFLRETSGLAEDQRSAVQKLIVEMQKAQEDERDRAKPTTTPAPLPADAQQHAPTPVASTPLAVTQAPPPKREVPTYKKPWVWVVVGGVVAAGVGLGLGFGLGSKTVDPSPTMGSLVKQ